MKAIALFAAILCWTASVALTNSDFPKDRKAHIEKLQRLIQADKSQFFSQDLFSDNYMLKDVYIVILDGSAWIDREGKIGMVNRFSKKEQSVLDELNTEVHPSVGHLGYNKFMAVQPTTNLFGSIGWIQKFID